MKNYFKVFLFTFFFILGIIYIGCSLHSSSWNPIMWDESIKTMYFPMIYANIILSAIVSWITN